MHYYNKLQDTFLRDHYMKNIHIYYFCQNKQEMEAARFKTLSNHVQ